MVVVAIVSGSLFAGVPVANATHEQTAGQASYSDGTAAKVASPGATLVINARLPRASGVSGETVREQHWRITIGRRYTSGAVNIPCYAGFRFVGPAVSQVGPLIPSSSFVVPALASGQWEVCFYSQPNFLYVTAPVTLTVP